MKYIPLERLEVKGPTDIPDFHATRSSHTLHLSRDFSASVNGTDGDTALQNVRSSILRSVVAPDGSIAGRDAQDGKTAALNIRVHEGHIEDLLTLFIKSKHAPMSGIVSLRAKAEVPPGPSPFLRKFRMEGDFGIGAGRFANTTNQSAINRSARVPGARARQSKTWTPKPCFRI